jgi:hypothetical protein
MSAHGLLRLVIPLLPGSAIEMTVNLRRWDERNEEGRTQGL